MPMCECVHVCMSSCTEKAIIDHMKCMLIEKTKLKCCLCVQCKLHTIISKHCNDCEEPYGIGKHSIIWELKWFIIISVLWELQ
jgi:hypothetical protein